MRRDGGGWADDGVERGGGVGGWGGVGRGGEVGGGRRGSAASLSGVAGGLRLQELVRVGSQRDGALTQLLLLQ